MSQIGFLSAFFLSPAQSCRAHPDPVSEHKVVSLQTLQIVCEMSLLEMGQPSVDLPHRNVCPALILDKWESAEHLLLDYFSSFRHGTWK